jgi:FKBP-type peptidyl-prolyl cis-trans isomerase FklB
MSLFDKLQAVKNKKMNEALEAGRKFLEENAKRPEVVSLPSGLQYEVLTMGDGPKPTANQTVKCHYHGTLIDGKVFDSSVRSGRPTSFPLNKVIMGWTQAVQLMPVGSKWRLYLPPHLAYGDRQTGPLIAPNSTLIFEVELLAI